MKVLRWGVCAVAALLMAGTSYAAESSDISEMKTAMENMKQEMDAMRATMSAEREAMRESAGGAPEALKSKAGNATVRIGGAVIMRYNAIFSTNNNDETDNAFIAKNTAQSGGGLYASNLGWDIDTMKVDFLAQINEDLSVYIDVRPETFDKAYFQWENIGGTGLGAQVGVVGFPGGMYSASFDIMNDVLIYDQATKESIFNATGQAAAGVSAQEDPTATGVKLWYAMDQFKITAGIFNGGFSDSGQTGQMSTPLTFEGVPANWGLSHAIMLEFTPDMIEGLGISFAYTGEIDMNEGSGADTPVTAAPGPLNVDYGRGSAYTAQFDLGATYRADKFGVWIGADYVINAAHYSNANVMDFTVGANVYLTDKFSIGAAYNLSLGWVSNEQFDFLGANCPASKDLWGHMFQVGAKYSLANGIWFRGTAGAQWAGYNTTENASQASKDRSDFTQSKVAFTLETGVEF